MNRRDRLRSNQNRREEFDTGRGRRAWHLGQSIAPSVEASLVR